MEKCSRRGGICEFEISIVFIESLFWKAVSFQLVACKPIDFCGLSKTKWKVESKKIVQH